MKPFKKLKSKFVTSPEGDDTFVSECAHGAVDDTGVRLVEPSLFDHLSLVLDQELDTLDGSGGGLGDGGSNSGEHEVLEEAQFLFVCHCCLK